MKYDLLKQCMYCKMIEYNDKKEYAGITTGICESNLCRISFALDNSTSHENDFEELIINYFIIKKTELKIL